MKKTLFAIAVFCLVIPFGVFAQYSNASFNGPWIVDGQEPTFIILDGSGTIDQLGTSDDTIFPVGAYSVTSSGVLTGSVNLIGGTQTINGQVLNDTSASFTVSGGGSPQYLYEYKVLNPAALEGVWNGTLLDSNNGATRNIQLTVNSTGTITAATGFPLIAGKIFAGRDTFAGYMTTTDDSCALQAIHAFGVFSGNNLTGVVDMGSHYSNCQSMGSISLTRTPLGIAALKPAIEFSVYPNPFTDEVEIAMSNPAAKTQIIIHDLCGRRVFAESLSDLSKVNLDLGSIGSGMYMLTLTDESGHSATKKIVKN